MRLKRILWISVVAASLSVSILPAQQHYDRRFARISYIDGNVVFRHAGDSDWVAGSINTPLQEQDRIYVPLKSRAELEFDDGSFLRMAEDTEVRIIRLDPGQIRVELPVGLTTIRHASDVDFHIDSPSASVHLLQKGDYRIEVPQNGSLDVMVRKGTAEILRGGETLRVRRNEAISVPVEATAQAAYRPIDREDAWDNWNDRRDASVMASASRRYIPSDVYLGAYELDRYGTWVDIADYGYCWRPLYVSYGWSPYRYGRWIHRPHWGWTWVSYEEWGWLPYHYGRWYYHPVHNWCWIPHGGFGLSIGFNFWSPGLVHFYHYGGGMHWVPLGPRDAHYGRNYFYNVNNVTYNNYYIRNIQNVRNVNLEHLPRDRGPQNVNVHNAIVSLDEKEFIGGRSGSRMRVPGQELVAHGRSFGSVRDIDLQPGAVSRSPRPEVDVRKMGIVDIQRDAANAGVSSHAASRSVRTIIPGGSGGEAARSSSRNAGGSGMETSARDRSGSANTYIPPASIRVIPGGSNRRAVDQEPGRRDAGLRGGDQQPASNEPRQEPMVNSSRRVIPGGARSIDSNTNPVGERDRQRNDSGGVPSNRRVIPGGERPATPPPNGERDQQRNEGGSAPSNRRVIPGGERPVTPPPTVERDQQRNDSGGASSGRRVIPGGERPINPSSESARSVRSNPSFGFSSRDAERSRSTTEWSSPPRVRVITPESSSRRESAPTYASPGQRDSGFSDRGTRSIERSSSFAAPQGRDRPSMGSSSPSMGSQSPAMRTPQNRSSRPERRPNQEQ